MTNNNVIERIRPNRSRLSEAMGRKMRRWGSAGAGLPRRVKLAGTREWMLERRGRKALVETDPGLPAALAALMNPAARGQNEPPLLWTCLGTGQLAAELRRRGHPVCDRTVAALLRAADCSLQDKRRCNEGSSCSQRDAQFAHISAQAAAFQRRGEPVIWVETGRAVPSQFAAESVARWWREMGVGNFPKCSRILVAADAGGSHAPQNRLWKAAFQDLAHELGLTLAICHFPPATTKWSKVGHCLPASPQARHEVKVHLIAPAPWNDQDAAPPVAEWNYMLRPRTAN
ncbi:MAG TPA: hypothetical protein VGO59_16395 [Verrucomicrobiae bacterium]